MNKTSKNQSGFSVVELLLVLVTLAIIGVVGYFVAKHVDKKTTPLRSATTAAITTTSATKQATSKAAAITSTKPVNYFTITQWGVRAVYDGNLNLQYQPTSGNPSNMTLISSACSAASGGAGYVGRYLPTDDIPTEGPPEETAQAFLSQDFAASNSSPPAYSKVNGYYYIYWPGTPDCIGTASGQQTIQVFSTLIGSLKAVN